MEIKKDLFKVEELEPRLEMVWDDNACAEVNNSDEGGYRESSCEIGSI